MCLKIDVAVQKRNFSAEFTSNFFFSVLNSCQKCILGFRSNQQKSKEGKTKYYFAICTVRRREGNCEEDARCVMARVDEEKGVMKEKKGGRWTQQRCM